MSETVGSLFFMAPELVNGDIHTEKVDIWAVGMIAYLLVTGKRIFDDLSVKALQHHIAFKAFGFGRKCWDYISRNMKNFIQKCLNKD